MNSHEDKVELKRGARTKGKFDLHESLGFFFTSICFKKHRIPRYREETTTSQVQKTEAGWTGMCWNQYKAPWFFLLSQSVTNLEILNGSLTHTLSL